MINMEINRQLQMHPNTPATVAMDTTEASTETLRPTFPPRSSSTFSLEEGFPQVSSCLCVCVDWMKPKTMTAVTWAPQAVYKNKGYCSRRPKPRSLFKVQHQINSEPIVVGNLEEIWIFPKQLACFNFMERKPSESWVMKLKFYWFLISSDRL